MSTSSAAAPAPEPSQEKLVASDETSLAKQGEPVEMREGDEEYSFTVADYLMSDKGHQALMQLLQMFAENQKAAIETQRIGQQAATDLEKEKISVQKKGWTTWMWVQIVVFVVAIGVSAALAWRGKLDAGVATLIGTLVGYVLGRSRQGQ